VSVSSPTIISTKSLLSGWERALLVPPAVAGLILGLFPLLLSKLFADVSQFPASDSYIYQLAGAATLGYGLALSIGLVQQDWLAVRLPVIAVLVFNLGSIYACMGQIFIGPTPYSVYVVLASSVLFVGISSLLLVRHRGVPAPEPNLDQLSIRLLLMVGAIAAGIFGLLPLFVPGLFTFTHLHINAPFVVRQAGAASLGYAVVAVLAQRALSIRELHLPIVMAAVFNGPGGIVSIPYLMTGGILLLPAVIAPVGLAVFVVCLVVLQRAMTSKHGLRT
jgi:hypothetical protein